MLFVEKKPVIGAAKLRYILMIFAFHWLRENSLHIQTNTNYLPGKKIRIASDFSKNYPLSEKAKERKVSSKNVFLSQADIQR